MLKNRFFIIALLGFILSLILMRLNPAVSFAEETFVYDAKGKRNPFIPLVDVQGRLLKLDKAEEVKGEINIEGIIYDKNGRCFALISGAVVGIGDEVNGFQVLKIQEKKVTLIKDGSICELEFKKEEK